MPPAAVIREILTFMMNVSSLAEVSLAANRS